MLVEACHRTALDNHLLLAAYDIYKIHYDENFHEPIWLHMQSVRIFSPPVVKTRIAQSATTKNQCIKSLLANTI